MKLSIVSDTHFGDDTCVLVRKAGNAIVKGPKYGAFLEAAGKDNDYLVLAGDVLDFSIASYEKAYEYARFFFRLIQADNIAKEIIYIAGNHDADIWHIVQHERAVINKLANGALPEQFEHSVAGIIDDRDGYTGPKLILNNVSPKTAQGTYGGMFLDSITGISTRTTFNFVFPSLYIATDSESTIVTHGQYLEPYWSFLGEILMKVASDGLNIKSLDMERNVELNFPLNQLACTGIGQAGALTELVRQIEQQVKEKKLGDVQTYLERLIEVVDEIADFNWFIKPIANFGMNRYKGKIVDGLTNAKNTRYRTDFITVPEVRDRFRRFYKACRFEINKINEKMKQALPEPQRFIFGHTHQPIAWNDPAPPTIDVLTSNGQKTITLFNTGGWLEENKEFCGAEVFKYETGKGFFSVSIR